MLFKGVYINLDKKIYYHKFFIEFWFSFITIFVLCLFKIKN
jgi:hypothetical protein